MTEILHLRPIFKEKIWGGTQLATSFNYSLPSNKIGECWAISAHPEGDCIITRGPYQDLTLSHVYQNHKELFANDPHLQFPLLVKLIDANQDLSIQVHPNDAYALKHEQQYGKSEAWIILNVEPTTRIQLGHHAQKKDEFWNKVEQEKWDELLAYRPLNPFEVIPVAPGTLHALCQGTLLLEIQQSSDVTYRVYDYHRLDASGKPRELHLKKALDVMTIPAPKLKSKTWNPKAAQGRYPLLKTPFFSIEQWSVSTLLSFSLTQSTYYLVSILDGQGTLQGDRVQKGDHLIITAKAKKLIAEGSFTAIVSHPLFS